MKKILTTILYAGTLLLPMVLCVIAVLLFVTEGQTGEAVLTLAVMSMYGVLSNIYLGDRETDT